MAVSVSQLRGWNPVLLTGIAEDIARVNNMFDVRVHYARRTVSETRPHWQGTAADAADARSLADELANTHLIAAVDAYSAAFGTAAREIDAVRNSVLAVVDSALADGFSVLDDGRVLAPVSSTGDAVVDLVLQSDFEERARGIEAQLKPLLTDAADTDGTCAARLQQAVDTVRGLEPTESATESYSPQVTAILDGHAHLPDEPAALADFWDQLTPTDKDGLAAWDPTIGNRDGLPADDKSRYNTQLLGILTVDARANLDAIEARHPDWMSDSNLPREVGAHTAEDAEVLREYARWLDDRDAAEVSLAGYENVHTQLGRDGAPAFLLNIDDSGRGAMALNNPDTAQNVATYVPGTSTVLASIDRDMSRAENLLDAANMASPGPNSVVTWLNYTSPPDLHAATSEKFADAGALRLDRFQDGLRAAHDGLPAHTTVIGHSYGSTVIGHAMRDGSSLDVDDVVFVGSPGVGVAAAEELSFHGVDPSENAAHVYATAAMSDPVAWTGGVVPDAHGSNPVATHFGATMFESDPETTPTSHNNYFDRGNPGLDTIGAIIVGRGASA